MERAVYDRIIRTAETLINDDYSASEAMTDLGTEYVKNKAPGVSQAEAVGGLEDLTWRKKQKRCETEAGVKKTLMSGTLQFVHNLNIIV